MDTVNRPSPRTKRQHYLDFLRGAMMSLGVVVHASHADYDSGDYELVRFASSAFRMECFFILSGFFVPMQLERYGLKQFVVRRIYMLMVPALFTVLLLNPLTIHWVVAYFEESPPDAGVPLVNWHVHTWFLFTLMLYTFAVPAFMAMVKAVLRIAKDRSAWLQGIALTLGALAVGVLGFKISGKVVPALPASEQYSTIVGGFWMYLPYFVLGMLLGRRPRLTQLINEHLMLWSAAAVLFVTAHYYTDTWEITSTTEHLIVLAFDYGAGFSVSFALMALTSMLVQRPSRWVRFFSDSAYTVYIGHYFFVAGVLLALQYLDVPLGPRFAIAAVVGVLGGLLLHHFVVRPWPFARLLLNGRWGRSGPPKREPSVRVQTLA